jgi:hypothetical protein
MYATQFIRLQFSLQQTDLSFDRKRQKILAGVGQHELWKIEGKFNCSKCMENSKAIVDIQNCEKQFFVT